MRQSRLRSRGSPCAICSANSGWASTAADPDERRLACGDVRRPGLESERLEPAITGADHGEVRKRCLDRRGQSEVPVHADQRMLGRLIAVRRRILEGSEEVGTRVRVADRNVDQRDAQVVEPSDQGDRLREVGLGRVVPIGPPDGMDRSGERAGDPTIVVALLIRDAVEDVQAGGDDPAGILGPDASHQLADEASPVLQRAAILARARPGGEELVEQVAMALLDIYEVEADPVGQGGCLGVVVLETVELVVGQERIVGTDGPSRDLVSDGPGIQERVVLGQ